jgi:hypothetical protein
MQPAGVETPVAKIDLIDRLLILAIVLLATVFVWNSLPQPPLEDAAILPRYAKFIAAGHGIVWNLGGEPVDGSTDFLFLLMVSGLVKGGLQPQTAARILDLMAHCLTIVLIYAIIRKRGASTRWAALISASYLGIGPAITYIWDGFGTPVFGLFVCLTWWLVSRIRENGNSSLNCALFALAALVTSLERPEGLFLAGLMLLSLIYAEGPRQARLAVLYFLGIVGIGGGLYFLWHWHYFGSPLPNTFYIRGGGHLFWGSLFESLQNIVKLSGPFALVYIVAMCSPRTAKLAAYSLIPIGGFGMLWLLLSGAMNHAMRYQYAILPILLLSWHPLWEGIHKQLGLPSWEDLERRDFAPALPLLVFLWCCLLFYRGIYWTYAGQHGWDPTYDAGVVLGQFKDKHYTLATSETGLLPFYSEWRAIDTWGLNDSWIAHHGTITESYLEREHPEVIVFHASFSPIVQPSQDGSWPFPSAWFAMVMTLKSYAERHGYCLAGSFGLDPHDTYYFYVRRDFQDSSEINARLRALVGDWNQHGRPVINFADFVSRGTP